MNQEIVDYIKAAKQHGLKDSEIKQNLLNAGWEGHDIENAFAHFLSELGHPALNKDEDISMLSKAMQQPAKEKAAPPLHDSALIMAGSSKAQTLSDVPVQNKKWGLKIGLAILLLVLASGGYYVYTYGFYTPNQVWEKFIAANKSKIYTNKFLVSYNDNSEPSENLEKALGIKLKNINLKFEGNYYVNAADMEKPESSAEIQYTFGSGGTNFSTGFKYRLKNKVLYLNVGSNPFLDIISQSLMRDSGQTKTLEWLKLDIEEMQKMISDGSVSDAKDYERLKNVFTPQFKDELEKIWLDAKIIKIKKSLGRKSINGAMTFGYENELDKEALKNLIDLYVEKLYAAFSEAEKQDSVLNSTELMPVPEKPDREKDLKLARRLVSGLIDKIEVKEFETWIGVKDFQIHRMKLVSNAPSLLSAVNSSMNLNPLESAREKSRDAKRLADMRQMASALELYFNDNNGYPEGLDGKPTGGITPTYIGLIPSASTPADGNCSEYYNTYWYIPKGTKSSFNGKTVYSSYEYTFCLGEMVGGYKAGIAKLTPMGIESGLECKDTPEHCKSQTSVSTTNEQSGLSEEEKQIDEFLSKLNFSAELNIEAEYNDYDKIRAIDEPKEFYDLTNILKSAQSKSRDAKRLADIRQFASALELYFNDNNKYPKELGDLLKPPAGQTNTYGGYSYGGYYLYSMPTAPTPPDGQCTESDNQYKYVSNGSSSYKLTFCLGADTGGYSAGNRFLSPAGIQ